MVQFISALLACSITMTVIAGLLFAITPLLSRRYSAGCVYCAWLIILAGFLVPFRPQPAKPAVTAPFILEQASRPVATRPEQAMTMARADTQPDAAPPEAAEAPAPAPSRGANAQAFHLTTAQALFALWAVGALAAAAVRVYQHHRFLRLVRRWGRPVCRAEWLDALQDCKAGLGIRRAVTLKTCGPIDSPMLIGLIRPTILLPDAQYDPEALRLILRHELVHLRRGDLWGRLLMLLASCIHWFNPVMPVIARELTFQCEAACDAQVMKRMGFSARQAYSETILRAIRSRAGAAPALSTRYHSGKRGLRRRILRILDCGRKRLGAGVVAAMMAAVACGGMLFAFTAAAAMEDIYVKDNTPRAFEAEQVAVLAQLNAEFAALKAQYGDALADQYPDLDHYSVRNTIMHTWNEIQAEIRSTGSAEALASLLEQSTYVHKAAPAGETDAYIEGLLEAAGYGSLSGRAYSYYDRVHGASEGDSAWYVCAFAAPQDDPLLSGLYARFYLVSGATHRLVNLRSFAAPYDAASGPIDASGSELARERAEAFIRAYGYSEPGAEEILFVSDRVYTAEKPDTYALLGETVSASAPPEPYTFAWAFTHSQQPAGPGSDYFVENTSVYDEANHSRNMGIELVIGTQTGRVYGMETGIGETGFVNNAWAERDWVERSGLTLPYVDDTYLNENVAPALFRLNSDLYSRYQDELSEQDLILALHLMDLQSIGLSTDHAWREFRDALTAAGSAEAYAALLRKSYPGINDSLPGMMERSAFEGYADDILAAFALSDYQYRSFRNTGHRYEHSGEQGYREGYEVMAGSGVDGEAELYLSITAQGKVSSLRSYYGAEGYRMLDEAERVAARQRAISIVNEWVDPEGKAFRLETAHTGELAEVRPGGDTLARVFLPYEETPATEDPEGVVITIGLDSGRVYQIEYAMESIFESDQRYYAQQWALLPEQR